MFAHVFLGGWAAGQGLTELVNGTWFDWNACPSATDSSYDGCYTGRRPDSLAQDGNTDEMEWDMHYLVADIARTITLEPGDLLLTGTPANSRPVNPGDVVAVEVEGLGRLENRIVHGPVPIGGDIGAQPSSSEEVISTAMGGDWEFRGKRAPGGPGSKHYESIVEKTK